VISIVANFMTRTSLQTVTMERATTPTTTKKQQKLDVVSRILNNEDR